MGFQQEDAQLINSLIDKKNGFVCSFPPGLYVLFHRGVSMDVENLKQINFRQPVPEYFLWPLGREHVPRDDEFNKKAIPKFNCGTWLE